MAGRREQRERKYVARPITAERRISLQNVNINQISCRDYGIKQAKRLSRGNCEQFFSFPLEERADDECVRYQTSNAR
jgi:hypothetical protein